MMNRTRARALTLEGDGARGHGAAPSASVHPAGVNYIHPSTAASTHPPSRGREAARGSPTQKAISKECRMVILLARIREPVGRSLRICGWPQANKVNSC